MSEDNCFLLLKEDKALPSKRKRVHSCLNINELSDGDEDYSLEKRPCSQFCTPVNTSHPLHTKDQPINSITSTARKCFTAGNESDELIVEFSIPGIGNNIKFDLDVSEPIPSPSSLKGNGDKGKSDLVVPSSSKYSGASNATIEDDLTFEESIPSPSFINFKSVPNDDDEIQSEIDEKPIWAQSYANRYRHKVEGSVAEFYQHKSYVIIALEMLYKPYAEEPKRRRSL